MKGLSYMMYPPFMDYLSEVDVYAHRIRYYFQNRYSPKQFEELNSMEV